MGTQQRTTQDPKQDPQHQGTSQVGTHGNAAATEGQPQTWDRATDRQTDDETRQMRQGDRTDPATPSGTTPLERDVPLKNQQR